MQIIEVVTKRGDSLFGCWYGEKFRDTCVIITNGHGGNIFENGFLRTVAGGVEAKGISFIYAHNSGAFQIINTPSKSKKPSGLTYELFDNCIEDLQAYVDFAKAQGYKKIILGGHSYGCNKVVYYLYKTKCKNVDKFILISPTDTEERVGGEEKSAKELLELTKEYRGNQILPKMFDGYNFYTAEAFLDFIENPHNKNLPIYHSKTNFKQLKSIKIPGIFVMGQNDPFARRDAKSHLQILLENSNQKSKNKIVVIQDAGHTFKFKEEELSKIICEFCQS